MTVPLLGASELVDAAAYNRLAAYANAMDTWTEFNWAFTASITNPTVSAASNKGLYSVHGKTGLFRLSLIWSAGDAVGNGNYSFGLPPAWDVRGGTAPSGFGTGTLWVIGGGTDRGISGWRVAAAGTGATIVGYQIGGSTPLSSASYAWSSATPDRVEITGWVPLA
jgi:hypothetical protein